MRDISDRLSSLSMFVLKGSLPSRALSRAFMRLLVRTPPRPGPVGLHMFRQPLRFTPRESGGLVRGIGALLRFRLRPGGVSIGHLSLLRYEKLVGRQFLPYLFLAYSFHSAVFSSFGIFSNQCLFTLQRLS